MLNKSYARAFFVDYDWCYKEEREREEDVIAE